VPPGIQLPDRGNRYDSGTSKTAATHNGTVSFPGAGKAGGIKIVDREIENATVTSESVQEVDKTI
jgi:hypothetical protein